MRFLIGLLNLIASLITIGNVILAVPSIFENVEFAYLTEITERNFALKFGFVLILQFGIGFYHSSFLLKIKYLKSQFLSDSFSLFSLLLVAWLTIFNITEILYSSKEIESFGQHLGMFFFLIFCYLIHIFLMIMSKRDFKFFLKDDISMEIWMIILGLLQVILFVVYWING